MSEGNDAIRQTLVVIDDDQEYLAILSELLRGEHYHVTGFTSGADALAWLATEPPPAVDCLLVDLMMPGWSGEETVRRIKQHPALRQIPLIMLTAHDDPSSTIRGITAGADDFIAKTADFAVLRARLSAQLRRKQIEDENHRIREELLRREADTAKAAVSRELFETRARLLEDLERTNQELRRARDEAERESQFKSRFLASMSHELRTPLNAIIGFSELLDQEIFGPLTAKQKEYVDNVLLSGRHLLTLINDVLDLSKVAAGRMAITRERTSLPSLLASIRTVVTPLADKQGIELQFAIPENLPPLYVDPLRLRQVIYNLLVNGIKFTPRGGYVRLTAATETGGMAIIVSDSGIGIRPEDLNRLFCEFERLPTLDGSQAEGTGLGLALSKRLVELHGGTIEVVSTPAKGSSFKVFIPMRQTVRAKPRARQGL